MNVADQSEVKVLLVDDDEEEYTVVRKYLKNARTGTFHVHWASTFEEALHAVDGVAHDVCLLDYQLGERTGIELLNEMRASGHDLPVILLTGRASLEMDLEAMAQGAFDFIEKGDLTPVLLERSIRYAIGNHRAQKALRQANEELEQRVRERTAELRRSNRDLEQFANVVARDLHEPLRAITRQIEAMKNHEAVQEQRGGQGLLLTILDRVCLAVRNMELLVQSVLDYSRLGQEAKPLEAVDLAEVVGEVWNEFDSTIRAAGATVDIGAMPCIQGNRTCSRGCSKTCSTTRSVSGRGAGEHPCLVGTERGQLALCRSR